MSKSIDPGPKDQRTECTNASELPDNPFGSFYVFCFFRHVCAKWLRGLEISTGSRWIKCFRFESLLQPGSAKFPESKCLPNFCQARVPDTSNELLLKEQLLIHVLRKHALAQAVAAVTL